MPTKIFLGEIKQNITLECSSIQIILGLLEKLISWDFHPRQPLKFTRNGAKHKKHFSSPTGGNALLIRTDRPARADRRVSATQITTATVIIDAQLVIHGHKEEDLQTFEQTSLLGQEL